MKFREAGLKSLGVMDQLILDLGRLYGWAKTDILNLFWDEAHEYQREGLYIEARMAHDRVMETASAIALAMGGKKDNSRSIMRSFEERMRMFEKKVLPKDLFIHDPESLARMERTRRQSEKFNVRDFIWKHFRGDIDKKRR